MTAEADISALQDGGANTAAEVRTALTSVLARADTEYVASGSTSVASVTDITLFNPSVTVAVGDVFDITVSILTTNNSGSTRTWTLTLDVGSLQMSGDFTRNNSATNKGTIRLFGRFRVLSTSAATLVMQVNSSSATAAGTFATASRTDYSGWQQSVGDETGSKTFSLKIRSSNATATQTAGWSASIRKLV